MVTFINVIARFTHPPPHPQQHPSSPKRRIHADQTDTFTSTGVEGFHLRPPGHMVPVRWQRTNSRRVTDVCLPPPAEEGLPGRRGRHRGPVCDRGLPGKRKEDGNLRRLPVGLLRRRQRGVPVCLQGWCLHELHDCTSRTHSSCLNIVL